MPVGGGGAGPGVEHLRVQAEQADPRTFGHRIENGIDVGAMRAPHGGVDPREHGHHEIGGQEGSPGVFQGVDGRAEGMLGGDARQCVTHGAAFGVEVEDGQIDDFRQILDLREDVVDLLAHPAPPSPAEACSGW